MARRGAGRRVLPGGGAARTTLGGCRASAHRRAQSSSSFRGLRIALGETPPGGHASRPGGSASGGSSLLQLKDVSGWLSRVGSSWRSPDGPSETPSSGSSAPSCDSSRAASVRMAETSAAGGAGTRVPHDPAPGPATRELGVSASPRLFEVSTGSGPAGREGRRGRLAKRCAAAVKVPRRSRAPASRGAAPPESRKSRAAPRGPHLPL